MHQHAGEPDGGVKNGKSKTQMVQGQNKQAPLQLEAECSQADRMPTVSYAEDAAQGLQDLWLLQWQGDHQGRTRRNLTAGGRSDRSVGQ